MAAFEARRAKDPIERARQPAAGWKSEQVFYRSDDYFAALERDLDHARDSIRLEAYIYENDGLGRRIAGRLIAASKRGVTVQLMVDGIGSLYLGPSFFTELRRHGVEVTIFHPSPVAPVAPERRGRSRLFESLNVFEFLRVINSRNHRKICVIDERIAYVGSMNVKTCHLEAVSGKRAWKDAGVRVEGEAVQDLARAFDYAWENAHRRLPRGVARSEPISRVLRLNYSRSMRQWHYRDLLSRICRAKNRVWITNAYFVPEGTLIRALCYAAREGVDVRVLVPRKSDIFFIRWVSSALYYALLKAGVRIFEYLPRILHSKVMIVDNWATVGSSNLNHRSLIHDLEVDVVLTRQDSKLFLERQFANDLKNAVEVTMDDWKKRDPIERILGRIFLFFRYWI